MAIEARALIFGDSQISGHFGNRFMEYLQMHNWKVNLEGQGSSQPKHWTSYDKGLGIANLGNLRAGLQFKPHLVLINLGGNIPVGSWAQSKADVQKLIGILVNGPPSKPTLALPPTTPIIWFGAPPYTLHGSRNTIIDGNIKEDDTKKRYKKAQLVEEALQGGNVGSLFNERVFYVNPCKDWSTFLPVYASFKNQSEVGTDGWKDGRWKSDGIHLSKFGAYEYIDNIVKNWKTKVYTKDPY